MRHAKKRLQLNRFTSWHDATLKSLAKSMILCQRMRTTLHRAKASRPLVEKLISLAKKNTLAARRQAQKIIGEQKLVSSLFSELGPLFSGRASGFTRIINLGRRRGDNAQMVIFELTEIKKTEKVKKAKKEKEATKPEAAAQQLEKERLQDEQGKPQAHAAETAAKKEKKTQKKFFGGLRGIFKRGRDTR